MSQDIYFRLMSSHGGTDPFDRHLFACAIALVLAQPGESLPHGLGLSEESLAALVGRHFPDAPGLLSGLSLDGCGSTPLAPEEPDLRALLLEHRTKGVMEEEWLAHIIARRSLGPNHLWQDLGLTGRADLSGLMVRHFRRLSELNMRDMKWKKFFYRELCQREGVLICKSPNCEVCSDQAVCFGAEAGSSLLPGANQIAAQTFSPYTLKTIH